jgi:hypothetical protein
MKSMRYIGDKRIDIYRCRNHLYDKVKRVVAQTETTSTTIDNSQCGGKDSSDNSLTPKRKSLFAYCEMQTPSKKMRVNIMDEINEEIMLFLKDLRYEIDLIFIKKNHFLHLHRLALKVLCVPAISAPTERIFFQVTYS